MSVDLSGCVWGMTWNRFSLSVVRAEYGYVPVVACPWDKEAQAVDSSLATPQEAVAACWRAVSLSCRTKSDVADGLARAGLEQPRPQQEAQSSADKEWSRGFFCALAKMIEMHGKTTPDTECLFSRGGDPSFADEIDQEVFRRHGLVLDKHNKKHRSP